MTERTENFYSLFTTCYICKYFIGVLHRCPWRSGSHDGLSNLRMRAHVQVNASFFHYYYYSAISHFNIIQLLLFFTLYDAQASSACSALISIGGDLGFSTRLIFIGLKPCNLIMLHVKFEIHRCSGFREKVI